MTLTAIAYLD